MQYRSYTQPQPLVEVRNVWVERDHKWILKDVSLSINEGRFVAIIGPNGAGKTTLFKAISGERPTHGDVFILGESIYTSPEYWLQQIGYVPVDNILHGHLTVKQALQYIGKLRLPGESAEFINDKIATLLTEFDLDDQRRDRYIHHLSSGERKRVNICAELLKEPKLLLLDEPTSNLDPDAELDLMRRLKERAKKGLTVMIVTHTLNTVNECDEVIFVENSVVNANKIGSPQNLLSSLETQAQVNEYNNNTFNRWASIFDKYKTKGRPPSKEEKPAKQKNEHRKLFAPNKINVIQQLTLLLKRYSRLRWNDWVTFLFTLLFGAIGGLFLFVMPQDAFLRPKFQPEYPTKYVAARQAVFVLSLIVSLIGLIASYREVSQEFKIYRHERAKGQSILAYILSKWIWLTCLVGILAPIFLIAIFLILGQRFPTSPYSEIIIGGLTVFTLILSCISAVSLGLLVSSIAGEKENLSTAFLAIAVIFHVLFSGLIKNPQIESFINIASALSTSRWAFEGVMSNLGLHCWSTIKEFEDFNSYGHIASIWLSSIIYTLICIALCVIVLRLQDQWLTPKGLLLSLPQNLNKMFIYMLIIILLTSWNLFIREQSYQYSQLTFFNDLSSGIEWADISKSQTRNAWQFAIGLLSQAKCY